MIVEELIELLQKEDPKRRVILQKDSEGNYYSPLYSLEVGAYRAKTAWYGERGLEELTDGDREAGYTEEDVLQDGVPALFLVPTN